MTAFSLRGGLLVVGVRVRAVRGRVLLDTVVVLVVVATAVVLAPSVGGGAVSVVLGAAVAVDVAW